jgi:mannose-6-phosphate isomerase-like protein (cupin superfamily)
MLERAIPLKYIALLCLAAASLGAATVDIISSKELRETGDKLAAKKTPFASENLKEWGNHLSMLAYRAATGSSEVHEHVADVFVIESGEGTLLTGGKLVSPHTEKAGELRGTSIAGGEKHTFAPGDVIHIPAGTPHQLLVDKGKPVTYFVLKVNVQ